MHSYMVEYPEGPVLCIDMQGPYVVDCSSCGGEYLPEECEYERCECGGVVGYQPHCRACYEEHIKPWEGVPDGQ